MWGCMGIRLFWLSWILGVAILLISKKAENGIFEDLKCCFLCIDAGGMNISNQFVWLTKKNDGRVRLACINDKKKKRSIFC